MTTFPELRDYTSEQDGDRIALPIGGVEYRFSKSIPMKLGMALTLAGEQVREMMKAGTALDDMVPPALAGLTEEEMRRGLIGDQWDRMLDGGVKTDEFERVYDTLFTYHMSGEEAALLVWKREVGREGDARPPAPSASKARTTSRSSSKRTTSAESRRRRSPGQTSSSTGTTSKRTSTASTE